MLGLGGCVRLAFGDRVVRSALEVFGPEDLGPPALGSVLGGDHTALSSDRSDAASSAVAWGSEGGSLPA